MLGVSNVASKHSSRKSSCGGKSSTTSSARIKAEADRAALLAHVAALKEKHALEEQEQQLKRRREQLELEAMLAASTAKLAVLQASDVQSFSKASSNAMNSYLNKEKRTTATLNRLNAMAEPYKPVNRSKPQQSTDWSLPASNPAPTVMLPQGASSQQWTAGPKEWTDSERQSYHHKSQVDAPLQLCSMPPCSMLSQWMKGNLETFAL